MSIQGFIQLYQAKSEEELLQLAAARKQLTTDARLALESELSRRHLQATENTAISQDGDDQHANHVEVDEYLGEGERQGVAAFVTEVLWTYHRHFWLFFKISVPAVILGTIGVLAARTSAHEIGRNLPRGVGLLSHRTEILEITGINQCAYLFSWIASSFSFAAICIALEETTAGFSASAWHSLLNVRQRSRALLRVSLLLYFLVGAAVVASGLLIAGVFELLDRWHLRPSHFLMSSIVFAVVAAAFLAVTRFALAVPAVVLDDCKVSKAIFLSDELTQGKWLILAALLAKSMIGGYVAAMSPFWLASVIHPTDPVPRWLSWILIVAAVIAVTIVEPTMFIGFALLYLKTTARTFREKKLHAGELAQGMGGI